MDRALWFLLRLRFIAWGRRISRGLHGIKGILLVLFGAIMLGGLVLSAVMQPKRHVDPELLRLYGTGALLAYCVMVVLTSAGGAAGTFTGAGGGFFFSRPLRRRRLPSLKIPGDKFS